MPKSNPGVGGANKMQSTLAFGNVMPSTLITCGGSRVAALFDGASAWLQNAHRSLALQLPQCLFMLALFD